jgi:dTDP-4-dehydrorhamnose reductase
MASINHVLEEGTMAERGNEASRRLELWGGVECTMNRVGNVYFQQMRRSGHLDRPSDIDRFADLGITAIRYPVLWEMVAPESPERQDWTWPDERLRRLRERGLRPIVGLTHHGSGPNYTSLVDPSFPEKLASYARSVAERYPWLTDFTPVNEPLTTARFSGLYGHWYPHGRDEAIFARTLVQQCKGVALAMASIREVIPGARLVQTEDLGRTYAAAGLTDVADFFNERRWLSLDLLCGRIDREHALWPYLRRCGIDEAELSWFAEHACPPDIMGINHYLTSDRYLEEDVSLYPGRNPDQCQGKSYVDVEAVRADLDIPVGTCTVLAEAWQRYAIPLAVTETHLGGSREEQLRWLCEVWDGATRLRRRGIDVRAVTVWSLLGSFDWNVLVTSEGSYYEPGPFDVRSAEPRPTALARVMTNLARTGEPPAEPVLSDAGWWRRPDRLFKPLAKGRAYPGPESKPVVDMRNRSPRPLLILGSTGTLGRALVRLCDARGIPHHPLGRRELDFDSQASIDHLLTETRAWAVVNAAGYVHVDDAEYDPDTCFRVNASFPIRIAAACAREGVRLLTFSSDLVFGADEHEAPYTETSRVAPLNVYGRSKAEMEAGVLTAMPQALVVRTSSFFGPWDEANFVTQALETLARGALLRAPSDQVVSPTYVPDLIHAALDLLIDDEHGLWHLTNEGAITWSELACAAAACARVRCGRIEPQPTKELGQRALRPRYSVLRSERACLLPPLTDALERYMVDRKAA